LLSVFPEKRIKIFAFVAKNCAMNFIRRDSVSIMEKITANTNAELYKSIMNLKNYNKSDFFMKKIKKFLTAFFLGCNF